MKFLKALLKRQSYEIYSKVAFFRTQIGGPNYGPQNWDTVKRFFACDSKSPGARA